MDLAELKLYNKKLIEAAKKVLIGPCGIETDWTTTTRSPCQVLIGPCGIETYVIRLDGTVEPGVLIGPCGIETLMINQIFVLLRLY